MLRRQLAQMSGIIVRQQISHCPPHVPKEPLRNFGTFHNPSSVCRQKTQGVITSPLAKLLEKIRRPILISYLPTVYVRADESALRSFSIHNVRKPSHKMLEVLLN